MRKQTGVSLKYMLDFGQRPIEKQMILSAQFLRAELPIRLAHRVAELENLPFGLSSMRPILKVRESDIAYRIPQCSTARTKWDMRSRWNPCVYFSTRGVMN